MLYSGTVRIKAARVELILSVAASKWLLDWKPLNDRILRGCFTTAQVKMMVIAVYAPTNESSISDKATLY